MKAVKKAVSLVCAVVLVTLLFSICAVQTVVATSASGVIDNFDRAPYSSFTKGVEIVNSTINYMGGRFRQETVDGNSVAVYQFAKGNSDDSNYNENGYGTRGNYKGDNGQNYGTMMLTYEDGSSFVPVNVESGKTYEITFNYKVLSVDTENYEQGISMGAFVVKNMGGWNRQTYLQSFHTVKAETSEWKKVRTQFTVGTLETDYTVMALGMNGYGEVMIDDIVIETVGEESTGKVVTNTFTLDFTTGGYSDTNCTGGGAKFLSRVTDPHDSTNTVIKLGCTNVSPLNGGRNIELADGNGSTSALITKPNAKYTVTIKYKAVGGSGAGDIQLHLGAQSAWASDKPKYQIAGSATVSEATEDATTWSTHSFSFSTTENQTYNEYDKSSSYTHKVNHIYIVRASGTAEGYTYIDDVTITETYTAPANQERGYDFSVATGCSAYNGVYGTNIIHTTDPDNASNGVVKLVGNGYSFELAESNSATLKPYKLVSSTSYKITFKYKVASGSGSGTITLYRGTQAAYSESLPKASIIGSVYPAYSQGNDWVTVTKEFTTTANQYYKDYKGGSNTNVVDKLYFVNSGSTSVYIDDIVITNIDGTQPAPEVSSVAPYERYYIDSFTHTPYKEAVIGDAGNDWRVSKRMFCTVDGDNSVLGYSYDLDIQADLINGSNSGSGNRGSAMGTNGYTASCTNLVTADGVAVKLNVGTAYKMSFNYKVTEIGTDSYIAFCANRGKYQYGWDHNYEVTTKGLYMFASEATVTDGWRYAEYTFIPDYTSDLAYEYLKIGMTGYGKALVDDIVVEVISPSEVLPTPSSDIRYSIKNGRVCIDGYTGRGAEEIIVPQRIAGTPVAYVSDSALVFVDTTKKLSFAEGLLTIGDYAFQNMTALETISIPSTVTSIGKRIFAGCENLKEIILADGNENYTVVDGVLYNADKTVLIAYPPAKEGTTFTVPSTVTQIADYAFNYAANLEEVILPSTLVSIGERAFENCSSLVTINIPSKITELKNSTFRGCSALGEIDLDNIDTYGINVFADCDALYTVGDMDNSNKVEIADQLAFLKTMADSREFGYVDTLVADINGDGTVDMLDCITLQRHFAGWEGYEELPSAGRTTISYDEYTSTSQSAELVINLQNSLGNYIKSGRDIARDTSKEDITIILIIGQSNSTTSVGYASEYAHYQKNEGSPTEAPTRPLDNTVYTGSYITELNDSNDVYELTDVENGRMFSGYSPALGKAVHEATGTKVVFIQCANGATGVHEWTKNCHEYVCDCDEKGKGRLYSNAVKNFLKTYNALSEDYNIVNMGYIWNQGEHEEKYATPNATVKDEQTYYDAYLSIHNDILADLDLDFGGIVMPRAYYSYHPECMSGKTLQEYDTVEHSRSSTVARHALYRAANDCSTLFVMDNNAEKITYLSDDPSNRIHYAQNAYNSMGKQAGESIGKYLNKGSEAAFEGITVYNSHGVVLATFDKDGNLTSGSKTVQYTADNVQLQIMINPLGTYYTYDLTMSNLAGFVNDFGEVDWTALNNAGYTTFDIVINTPKF